MAVLFIAEYVQPAQFEGGNVVAFPQEPPIAEQTVAIGGASVQSAAFNAKTTFVRIHTDVICSVKFGTNPTASATTARMAGGQERFVGVPVGQAFKVAVITNT
jgi:hypothetical protein